MKISVHRLNPRGQRFRFSDERSDVRYWPTAFDPKRTSGELYVSFLTHRCENRPLYTGPCNSSVNSARRVAQIWGRSRVSGIKGRIVMRKSSMTLLSRAVIGLAASQASAADLPRKAPAYVPPAPPPITWTGCYIGANIGGVFGPRRCDFCRCGSLKKQFWLCRRRPDWL